MAPMDEEEAADPRFGTSAIERVTGISNARAAFGRLGDTNKITGAAAAAIANLNAAHARIGPDVQASIRLVERLARSQAQVDLVKALHTEALDRFEAVRTPVAMPALGNYMLDIPESVSARNSDTLVEEAVQQRVIMAKQEELLTELLAQVESAAQREAATAAADERRHKLDILIAVLLVVLGALLGAVLSALLGS